MLKDAVNANNAHNGH